MHTAIAISALYAALRTAWREQVKAEPARSSLLVLMAQWGHETDNGRACLNFNCAGIKWTPGCGADYAPYMTWELVNGARVTVEQKFRAYPTLVDGVEDYMRVLRRNFGYAWPAVEAGDTAAFAAKLKARGYYTDTLDNYTRGLATRYAQMDALVGDDTQPDVQLYADEAVRPVPPSPAIIGTDDDAQPTPPGDLPPAAA